MTLKYTHAQLVQPSIIKTGLKHTNRRQNHIHIHKTEHQSAKQLSESAALGETNSAVLSSDTGTGVLLVFHVTAPVTCDFETSGGS